MCGHRQPISGDSRGHMIDRQHPEQSQDYHEIPGSKGDKGLLPLPLPQDSLKKSLYFLLNVCTTCMQMHMEVRRGHQIA